MSDPEEKKDRFWSPPCPGEPEPPTMGWLFGLARARSERLGKTQATKEGTDPSDSAKGGN